MGHPQYQNLTVMGESVVVAGSLCAGAARDRSIILSDENTLQGLERRIQGKPVSQASLKKIKGNQTEVFEVTGYVGGAAAPV